MIEKSKIEDILNLKTFFLQIKNVVEVALECLPQFLLVVMYIMQVWRSKMLSPLDLGVWTRVMTIVSGDAIIPILIPSK